MFSESAELYDLIYAEFKDYAAEAEQVAEVVLRWRPEARSILDLGCGTGRHAALLTESLGSAVDGLDINEDFVDMAAARCPAGRFTKGDMSEFDLGRSYDVILSLFSAIGYVRTVERLDQTARCISKHLNPGGVALIEPWFTPEGYSGGKLFMNTVDQPQLKIVRMSRSVVRDAVSVLDFKYLVARPEGIEQLEEVHELGLFSDAQMRAAFAVAGLEVVDHDHEGLIGRGLYVLALPE